jgi:Pheromone A receptor
VLNDPPELLINRCDAEYIVTPYSYGIFEDLGCQTLSSFTVPAILLFNAWPLVIGCVSFVYCCTYALLTSPSLPQAYLSTAMILYHFIKRKRKLTEVMASHQGLQRNRYIRLMLLCCSEMLITVPYSSFLLFYAFKHGLTKFSWSTLRHNYTHVPQYSTIEWQSDPVEYAIVEVNVWSFVYCAFIFFAFFGFAADARDHYRRVYTSITRRMTRIRFSKSSGITFTESSHPYVVVVSTRVRVVGLTTLQHGVVEQNCQCHGFRGQVKEEARFHPFILRSIFHPLRLCFHRRFTFRVHRDIIRRTSRRLTSTP